MNWQPRKPCVEIGHEFWHTPVEKHSDGTHEWECRYCLTRVKTPGKDNPRKLEKILVWETEEHLRKEAERE